jgi:flagellar hook assembly protein FlgD
MSPSPVKTTGTAAFTLSASASVTVRIVTAQGGAAVRSLLSGAFKPEGKLSLPWDRLDAAGRRVAKGTYRIEVDAIDAAGQRAGASASFSVS